MRLIMLAEAFKCQRRLISGGKYNIEHLKKLSMQRSMKADGRFAHEANGWNARNVCLHTHKRSMGIKRKNGRKTHKTRSQCLSAFTQVIDG